MTVNYQFVPMCYLQARFEAPLGGATAVEDLRESFGFEGDLPQLSPTEQITSPFRRQSGKSSQSGLCQSSWIQPRQLVLSGGK